MAEFNLEGLLGNAFGGGGGNVLDEYLTPEQRAAMQRNAMLAASAALLKAGGESTRRIGIGEALGGAFEAGQAGYEKAQTGALTQMSLKQKLQEAKIAAELRKRISGIMGASGEMESPQVTANKLMQSGRAAMDAGDFTQAFDFYKQAREVNPPEAAAAPIEVTGPDGKPMLVTPQRGGVYTPVVGISPKQNPSEKSKQLAELGLTPTLENFQLLESSPNEIKLLNKMGMPVTMANVERIKRSGATNVSVGGQVLEKAEQKGMGEFNVETFKNVSIAAGLAQKTLPSLDVQSQILAKGFTTGFGTDAQKAGASVLASLGVPEANKFATDAQTFLAATQQAVLQKQLEQKGPQTEADSKRVTQTGAQLGNTVDANRFIIDVAKEQLKRDIERKKFLESWWKTNKTLEGADDAWYTGAGGQSLFDSPGLKKYAAPVQAPNVGGFKYLGKVSK